ncbi:hypothetical protein [Methylobacterium crusticola]|nr:hypothetical protein [Methylobacterium crusticola]
MQKQMLAMQQELADLRHRASARQAEIVANDRRQRAQERARERTATTQVRQQQVVRTGGRGSVDPASNNHLPVILAYDLVCGSGSYVLGQVCFTPGGFIELTGIFRNLNLVSDVETNFGGIPFRNSPLSRENEFRFSARQSRFTGMFMAKVDPELAVTGYYELDFLGAAVNSNSRESNSYVPRIRQLFAALDSRDTGWHVLAGQAYSLITTNTVGITPLKEQIPLTIDPQFVPGFNWTRNPQVRVVKDVAPGLWAAVALESPQSVLPPSPFAAPNGVSVNFSNPGDVVGQLNSTTTYSNNSAPDVTAKLAFEPGFGHYEVKGLARFFNDRVIGRTNDATGYGIGASATFPVLDKRLDFQISGLVGRGIGRYGTALLPDFALRADGSIAPIPAFQLLTGVVGHVQPGTDVYVYAGWEQASRAGAFSTAGYGSPTLTVTGCNIEGSAAATCQAETREIRQITGGFWHDLYKGSFGRLAAGAQISYTERTAFRGEFGINPSTHLIVGLASLRYYPF